MMKPIRIFAMVLMPMLLVPAVSAGQSAESIPLPELAIPECTKPPVLDGKLDDQCWKESSVIDSFYIIGGSEKTGKHKVYLCRDDAWLYVGFDMTLP